MRVNQRNSRLGRNHANWLPPCMVAVFGSLLILLYVVGFVRISGQLSHEQSTTGMLRQGPRSMSGTANGGFTAFPLQGSVSCSSIDQKVMEGEWVDPNDGKIYARETVSLPRFRVSLHHQDYDEVRWRIMEEGKYYEQEVHDRFVQILSTQPPSLVLDVGANIGYYTLLSLSLGHHVVAFEPNPANLLRLCDSLRLNDWNFGERVQVFQKAVGDVHSHGQPMTLHAPRNPGQGFLKPVEEGDERSTAHKAMTTLVSLDKFADEQGWFALGPTIALLKVDVEGKDPHVILGAAELLQSGLIRNVLTECRRFGRPTVSEMFIVLLEAGFRLAEPNVDFKQSSNAKDKAQAIVDWAFWKLGRNSQNTVDMWWKKE